MEVTISLHIELDEDRELDVAMIGEIILSDGTFIEGVSWDSTMYTKEENALIAAKVFTGKMYEKFFDAYEKEMQERLIENYT